MKQYHIGDNCHNMRVDRWLREQFPHITLSQIHKALRTGKVKLNGKKTQGNMRLSTGDNIISFLPEKQSTQPIKHTSKHHHDVAVNFIKQHLIFEDDDIIIINKPHGLAVQGGAKQQHHLDQYLRDYSDGEHDYLRLTHRIDKDTSGVLLLAKNRTSARKITQQFADGGIEKTYLAITHHAPRDEYGVIEAPLLKKQIGGQEKIMVDDKNGQYARSDYQLLRSLNNGLYLLSLSPKTGRKHQLRAHCAHIGCPILGDKKYGKTEKHEMCLHAYKIKLPDYKDEFAADLPKYFSALTAMHY